MKIIKTDWKRCYWPEPRLGTKETRRDVLVRLGKLKPRASRSLPSLADALALLEQMSR